MPKPKKKASRKTKKKGAVKGRVQALNPKTGRWVKIDTTTGCIIGRKKSEGAYKNIPKGKRVFYSNVVSE